jgi:hypothetical protein
MALANIKTPISELQDGSMCRYIVLTNICGCHGPPWADPDEICPLIMQQINRINEPEAWEGDAVNQIPYQDPPPCVMGWHNLTIVTSNVPCDRVDCPAIIKPAPCQWQ